MGKTTQIFWGEFHIDVRITTPLNKRTNNYFSILTLLTSWVFYFRKKFYCCFLLREIKSLLFSLLVFNILLHLCSNGVDKFNLQVSVEVKHDCFACSFHELIEINWNRYRLSHTLSTFPLRVMWKLVEVNANCIWHAIKPAPFQNGGCVLDIPQVSCP